MLQETTRPRLESRLAGVLFFHFVDILHRAGVLMLLHRGPSGVQEAQRSNGGMACLCIVLSEAVVRLALIAPGAATAFRLWRAAPPRDIPAWTRASLAVLTATAVLSAGPFLLSSHTPDPEEQSAEDAPMTSFFAMAAAECLRRRIEALRQLQLPPDRQSGGEDMLWQLRIPRVHYSTLRDAPWRIGGDKCAICLSDYSDEDLVFRLPCDHVYHAQCIQTWAATPHRGGLCAMRCSWPAAASC